MANVRYVSAQGEDLEGDPEETLNLTVSRGLAQEIVQMQREILSRRSEARSDQENDTGHADGAESRGYVSYRRVQVEQDQAPALSGKVAQGPTPDIEFHEYHCHSELFVIAARAGDPVTVKTVLDSGSGMTCISSRTAERLKEHFGGEYVVCDFDCGVKARVSDGRVIPIGERTVSVRVTLMTPWAPVIFDVTLAIVPGDDDVLIIGSKTLRERLGIDVMEGLRKAAAGRKSGAAGEDQVSAVAVTSRTRAEPADHEQGVAASSTRSGVRLAKTFDQGEAGGAHDIADRLSSRGPSMFMNVHEERALRRECLEEAVSEAARRGMPLGAVERLRRVILRARFEGFRRALTGEPPADVEPLRVKLRPGADLQRVKAKPRMVAPEKREWLEKQMEQLMLANMVYANPQASCASAAMAVPKGPRYRMVADYRAANAQVELVPWPMPNLEEATAKFRGVPAFCSLDLLQGYWQMPLDPESQELFTIVLPSGLYTPTRVPQGMLMPRPISSLPWPTF